LFQRLSHLSRPALLGGGVGGPGFHLPGYKARPPPGGSRLKSMRLPFRVREREHVWSLQVTSINYSGLGICSLAAANINALTDSMRLLFRVRESEHAAFICLPLPTVA
jgi:hypothetical protein